MPAIGEMKCDKLLGYEHPNKKPPLGKTGSRAMSTRKGAISPEAET